MEGWSRFYLEVRSFIETEVNLQVLKRKRNAETQLNTELTKRRRLEKEVKKLEKKTKEQSKAIAQLRTGHSSNMRGLSLKSWPQCSTAAIQSPTKACSKSTRCSKFL